MNNINEDNRLYKIINIIQNGSSTTQSIANKLGVSTKTVKNEIKELNKILDSCGLIELKQGRYILYIIDLDKFEKVKLNIIERDDFFNSQNNRIAYIFNKLMNSKTPYLIDDLADEMSVGRTTFIGDLKKLRKSIEKYNLHIVGKTNTGLFLQGEETNIRVCILEQFYKPIYGSYKIDLDILDLLSTLCRKNSLGYSSINYFTKFFTVMIDRLLNDYEIKDFDENYEKLKNSTTFNFINEIFNEVEKKLHISIPENERVFMVLPIISMRTPINSNIINGIDIEEDTIELVNDIINLIKKQMNITIMPGDFLEEFICHMFFMINRVKFGLSINNSLLDEIEKKYPVSYKMAQLSKELIENKLNKTVSKDEVGFMAMYFGVFISQSSYERKRICKIAVICGSGVLTARIVSSQLKKLYQRNLK